MIDLDESVTAVYVLKINDTLFWLGQRIRCVQTEFFQRVPKLVEVLFRRGKIPQKTIGLTRW